MTINNDNYEAYLLDYVEGNLSPEGAAQLRAFVETQGLDWAELTENLPRLEAPQIAFEDKARLKKQRPIVPLYAKIASAAAAAGLLLTVGLWPAKSMPKEEPIAELTPIQACLSIESKPFHIAPRKIVTFAKGQESKKEVQSGPTRMEVEVIAALTPMKAQEITSFENTDFVLASDIELLGYRLEHESALARLALEQSIEDETPTSLIGKGIYRMTAGRRTSIGDLINAGLHIAKKEVVKVSTDAALATYYRAEEHIEEAKEQWQEKRGE